MTDHTTPHADRCESCASTAPARRYRYTYDPEAMDEVWRDQTSVLLCGDCYDFAYTSAMPIELVECDAGGGAVMRVYIVTRNLTGYLPESAPYYTTDRDSAYAYVLGEIDARVEYLHQMPLEYCDDAWQAEVEQITDMGDGCLAARDNGDDAWSDQTIGAPYVTFSVESFPCDTAADLASWAECSLADLELPDTASVDDVCDALNQEGW